MRCARASRCVAAGRRCRSGSGDTYYINIASQILLYAVFALGAQRAGRLRRPGFARPRRPVRHRRLCRALLLAAGLRPLSPRSSPRIAVTLVATAVFAVLALRATGIGFLMITLALGQIVWGIAYRWISLTNGDNGLNVTTRPAPFGSALTRRRRSTTRRSSCSWSRSRRWRSSSRSPFGAALRGTRDQPRRMNALGYNVWLIRFFAFLFSGSADRRRRAAVRLLQPVHQPAGAGAHRLGRGRC